MALARAQPRWTGATCYDNGDARQTPIEDMDLDSLWDDKATFLYNCSVECLFRLLEKLKQYWLNEELVSINRLESIAEHAMRLFKIPDPNQVTPVLINKQYSCAFMQTLRVIMAINVASSRMAIPDGRLRGSIREINRIFRVIHGMHLVLQNCYDISSAWRGQDSTISSKLLELQRYTPIDENKAGPKGVLIRHITQRLAARRLRRCGGDVYEEIIVNGHHTHAWKRLYTIQEFIYANCRRHQEVDMYSYLTGTNNMVQQIEKYLMEANDVEFPELIRDRHIFSFRNGIYVAYQRSPDLDEGEPDTEPNSVFYFYDDLEDPECASALDDSIVAINYFDMDMPEEILQMDDPFLIPTPTFDQIFKDQDVPEKAMLWIYVLVGRLFYDLRELDDWEVLLFIRGVAGSGKSTLGKIIRRIYPASCVGFLSSNVQKKFALEGVYDKLIWICYEMRENWADNIDQADLQSMISGGEEVVVNCKFKRPMHMVWTAPGLAIGNQSGGWVDNMGSITRRVVPVEFNIKVREVDTRLFKKLNRELPHIILKCNMAYQSAVEQFVSEGMDVWEAMSLETDYFKNTQAKLRRETNSFADFLESCEKLERGADKFIPYTDLNTLYRVYCKQYNTRPQKLTGDNFLSICREENLQYEENAEKFINWMGKTVDKVVYNIGFKEGHEPAPGCQ